MATKDDNSLKRKKTMAANLITTDELPANKLRIHSSACAGNCAFPWSMDFVTHVACAFNNMNTVVKICGVKHSSGLRIIFAVEQVNGRATNFTTYVEAISSYYSSCEEFISYLLSRTSFEEYFENANIDQLRLARSLELEKEKVFIIDESTVSKKRKT